MKKTLTYGLLSCSLWLGCRPPQPDTSVAMTVLLDRTDSTNRYPTAEELVDPLGLDDDQWRQVSIRLTTISDLDINTEYEIVLKPESRWTGNSAIRKANVLGFKSKLRNALDTMQSQRPSEHSIIYRTIAMEANRLAAANSAHKALLVYSNLYENSEVSFYDPQTLNVLRSNPKKIELRLTGHQPINELEGMTVWLLHKPASYDENSRYSVIAKFYGRLFERQRATVYVGNKFSAP